MQYRYVVDGYVYDKKGKRLTSVSMTVITDTPSPSNAKKRVLSEIKRFHPTATTIHAEVNKA